MLRLEKFITVRKAARNRTYCDEEDGETERQLLQNLRELTDKTVIIITHRPEALKICTHRVELAFHTEN